MERVTKRLSTLVTTAAAVVLVSAVSAGARAAADPLAGGHRVYVSPAGNDAGDGSRSHPFATVTRAQQAARGLVADGDVVVVLSAGTYQLAAPLQFDQRDSGPDGHHVTYQPAGYGTPGVQAVTISGGQPVTDWQVEDGTWHADVGDLDTRQLYVDGKRAGRAQLDAGHRGGIPGTVTTTSTGYVTDSTVPQTWADPSAIEMIYRGMPYFFNYSEERCGVAGITGDAAHSVITMDQPCYGWLRKDWTGDLRDSEAIPDGATYKLYPGPPTMIENSLSFLTEPGTFYLDESVPHHHVLHYRPRSGEQPDTATVVAPVLQSLVVGDDVRGLQLRGLTFAYATWLQPSRPSGLVGLFGPIYEAADKYPGPVSEANPAYDADTFDVGDQAETMPGAVAFHGSDHVALIGDRFVHLGGQAVEFSLDSSFDTVRGNLVSDVSGGGIEVGNRYPVPAPYAHGFPQQDDWPGDKYNGHDVVADNWVHDVGIDYSGSVGIYVEAVQDAVVEHNQVNHTSYSGIVLGQYWTVPVPTGDPSTSGPNSLSAVAARNVVRGNLVFDALNALTDGGPFWTAGPAGTSWADGSRVVGNVFRDDAQIQLYGPDEDPIGESAGFHDEGHGLYIDDDSDYLALRGNVVYSTGQAAYGGADDPMGHVRLAGNFWDNATGAWTGGYGTPHVHVGANTLLSADHAAADCAARPACAAVVATAGLRPRYRGLLTDPTGVGALVNNTHPELDPVVGPFPPPVD